MLNTCAPSARWIGLYKQHIVIIRKIQTNIQHLQLQGTFQQRFLFAKFDLVEVKQIEVTHELRQTA